MLSHTVVCNFHQGAAFMLRSRLITLKKQKQFVSYFKWICTYRLNPGNVLFHQEYSFLLAKDTAQSIFKIPPFWNIWGAMRTYEVLLIWTIGWKWDLKSFNTLRVVVCARQRCQLKTCQQSFFPPFISSFCCRCRCKFDTKRETRHSWFFLIGSSQVITFFPTGNINL